MSVVEAKVAHDTQVVRASVGFEKIVGHIKNEVIVKIDVGLGPPVFCRHRAASLMEGYSVYKIGNMVVTQNVALPCNGDPIEAATGAAHFRGEAGQLFIRNNVAADLTHHYLWIEASDGHVISDIEVF